MRKDVIKIGEVCIIYGKSGTGKSRSLKEFDEDEILFVNTVNKRLPFQKKFKYEYKTADVEKVKNALKKMPTKTAVIDDFGYQQTAKFMAGHNQRSGGSSFDLYNAIADDAYGLIMYIKDELPDDIIVYLIMHEETSDYGDTKLKTIGKLLDQKVCVEGMVTICLRAMKEGTSKYFFRTQSDGQDISKSPENMFDIQIDNNLAEVDKRIREYWGL
ncbi:MAG: AAA family ATPase [Clostridiales bacterium]|nr:AAA family ATPase [Clostridiales bacterium]